MVPRSGRPADTMTSPQMAAHRRDGGILLLPVGCFEMHDRHVGLSCDTFRQTIRTILEEDVNGASRAS